MDALTIHQAREMDNDELRALVAQMLDYRLYEGNGRYGRYVFCGPWLASYSEEQLTRFWNGVRAYATPEEARTSQDVPDWPEDLHDAVGLMDGLDWILCPADSGGYSCLIEWGARTEYGREHAVEEIEDGAARAVTLAWVAWKLAQDD